MKRTYDVCVVGGLGHIGLPLGIALAKAGKRVMLFDIDKTTEEIVKAGKVPFMENGAEEALQAVLGRNLFISSDRSVIKEGYFIVIVIGTPVDEHLNPEFTIFKKVFSEFLEFIDDNQHIILRSTVYPGTTKKIKELLKSNGRKTKVSFCPERIAEGKAIEELKSLPQIVSSFDDKAALEAKELFLCLTEDVILLKPEEAELAKLFTNAWRYIQFSIANQFYEIATDNGLDFYRIFDAITFKYPRANGFPGAGFAAGPCLFKDTMQLAAFNNNSFFLGHAAMLINEGLPNFIVERLKNRYPLHEKTVGILGMAFKGDNDDIRESLSFKLKKILEIEAKKVLCTDPYVRSDSLIPIELVLEQSDILILGAPHSQYKGIEIDNYSKEVVDIWNFFGKGGHF
ncbi:MAG: nucleotide sugar dehydrogenase [Syntrophobacterales bacterium]|jgi:UDP-N-acetyl-D-mannosaminuronic acid dehydrogenase|nr:nucleotide sugar dehydrogenase [Syntrophobacterales bacterium]